GDVDAGDIANLQYSVQVYVDNAAYQAWQLTQSKGLADPHAPAPNQPFYANARGLGEKYFLGTGGIFYYILPSGQLFQYVSGTPTSLNGTLLATLDPAIYWVDPSAVLTATPADVSATFTTVSGHGTTSGQVHFVAGALQAFSGTLHVVASVS